MLHTVWRCFRLVSLFSYAAAELLLQRPQSRETRAEWLHRFCARAMRHLDVVIQVTGDFPVRGALISNHVSYLDIVVYAALHRCVFVSKAEIEHWPILGWMTTMAGTVYVERGRRGSTKRMRQSVDAVLKENIPLVFFPEGTTSDGEGVLKFHGGLLGQVTAGKEPVTAAFIRYALPERTADGGVREYVHFWGETSMLRHVLRFLSLRGVRADVIFAPGPIRFTADPLLRKQVAVEARHVVCALGDINVESVAHS